MIHLKTLNSKTRILTEESDAYRCNSTYETDIIVCLMIQYESQNMYRQ
jgi:hypothetical protein